MASIAVAWLKESDWAAWQKLDDQLSDYTQWCSETGDAITHAEHEGMQTEKISIAPEPFVAWCNAQGIAFGGRCARYMQPISSGSGFRFTAQKISNGDDSSVVANA